MRQETIGNAMLILGDMMDVLPGFARIDAIVTDPPYGIGEAAGKNRSRGKVAKAKDYGDLAWDDAPCSPEQIAVMRQVSRWQIIFGGNYFDLPPSSCWLVWDKKITGDFADCELAWTNLNKAVRRIEWTWNGMIRQKSPDGYDDVRVHPTQKPSGVMEWCIDRLPDDVETVCDPFMGSGTTGIAALRRGKRFIGIEREASYFEASLRRIEKAAAQPDIFNGVAQAAYPEEGTALL